MAIQSVQSASVKTPDEHNTDTNLLNRKDLTDDERFLIEFMRSLSDVGRQAVIDFLRKEITQEQLEKIVKLDQICFAEGKLNTHRQEWFDAKQVYLDGFRVRVLSKLKSITQDSDQGKIESLRREAELLFAHLYSEEQVDELLKECIAAGLLSSTD